MLIMTCSSESGESGSERATRALGDCARSCEDASLAIEGMLNLKLPLCF